MKLFCQKCTSPTVYTDKRPAFCSQCGNPFVKIDLSHSSQGQSPPTPKKVIPVQMEPDEDNTEDEPTSISITNVPKLEFETIGNLRNRTTLGQWGKDRMPKQEIIREKQKKKKNFKEFEREWESETRSSKQNPKDLND